MSCKNTTCENAVRFYHALTSRIMIHADFTKITDVNGFGRV